MKKLLLKFADQVLSREELKSIRGACGCDSQKCDAASGSCYYSMGSGKCKCNGVGVLLTCS